MPKPISCLNCLQSFEGKYCPNCGEKVYSEKDRSVGFLIKETLLQLTNFEGTFFNTVKAIFLNPGKLSTDYVKGIRKPYFKPISFYLLVIVLYLLFPVFKGLNMDMFTYRTHAVIGHYAKEQIASKCETQNIPPETLQTRFNSKSESASKLLLLLFIPLSSFMIALLYWRKKSTWFYRLVMGTEINIFYMLVIFLILPIIYIHLFQNTGILSLSEDALGMSMTLIFSLYVSVVFRNSYSSGWMESLLKGLGFSLLHTLMILFLYKPLVFICTMWLV